MTTDYKNNLRKFFDNLFHFESVDLENELYNIINQNHKIIDEFIHKGSIKIINKKFKDLSNQKKIKIQNEIFCHIYHFFSYYYNDCEFFSLQKYGKKRRYPLQNTDVTFYWRNKKHYYIKTEKSEYFVHKDLKEFLTNELDFFIKNEVIKVTDGVNLEFELQQSDIVRTISEKIIELLVQIEEFLKKFWEKKKFVLSTDYLITLDYINEKYYPEILENKKQLTEWEKNCLIQFPTQSEKQLEMLKRKSYLCLDTKLFSSDFKYTILSSLGNLSDNINGILIKSENYQAMNLLSNKYGDTINFCYIDPPYNTGTDEFLYKDDFFHSSWITLMKNRLDVFYQLISEDGTIFCSIDDKEQPFLRLLCDDIFGEENFVSFIWKKKGFSSNTEKILGNLTEHILCYFKEKREGIFNYRKLNRQYRFQDKIGPYNLEGIEKSNLGTYKRETMRFPITDPETNEIFYPRKDKRWTLGEESLKEAIKNGKILFDYDKKRAYLIKRPEDYELSKNVYYNLIEGVGSLNLAKNELRNLFGNREIFDTPKPTKLLIRLLEIASKSNSIILDFFAGSGTTGQAVLQLNKKDNGSRKFILIEIGEFFDSILKPRIIKAIYSTKWKNGKPVNKKGIKKQIIKYHLFEQYDDALNCLPHTKDYFLHYDYSFKTNHITANLFTDIIQDPFNIKMKVKDGNETKIYPVDLIETFNYLLGIYVEKIDSFSNDVTYRVIYGTKNETKITIIWRNIKNLDLSRDKKFIEDTILKTHHQPDTVYINGKTSVKKAILIDNEMKKLMDA